jgi:hypothetical protein
MNARNATFESENKTIKVLTIMQRIDNNINPNFNIDLNFIVLNFYKINFDKLIVQI